LTGQVCNSTSKMALKLTHGKKAVQEWCTQVTQGYPGVNISDLSQSFHNGVAFCAIINKFSPELLDFSQVQIDNTSHNVELAINAATAAGIATSFESQDIVDDEKVYDFVCLLFKKYNPESPILKRELQRKRRAEGGKEASSKPTEERHQESTSEQKTVKTVEPLNVSENPQPQASEQSSQSISDQSLLQTVPQLQAEVSKPEENIDVDALLKETDQLQSTFASSKAVSEPPKLEETPKASIKDDSSEPLNVSTSEKPIGKKLSIVKQQSPTPSKQPDEPVKPIVTKRASIVKPSASSSFATTGNQPRESFTSTKEKPLVVEEKSSSSTSSGIASDAYNISTSKSTSTFVDNASRSTSALNGGSTTNTTNRSDKPTNISTNAASDAAVTGGSGVDEEEVDVDDLLNETIDKSKRRHGKRTTYTGDDVETVEEALKDAHQQIDALDAELSQKIRELSRYKKQNSLFNIEIKKLLQQNTQLTDDARGANMRLELETKARQELQFRYDNDFKKLEEELQTTKKALEEEISSKKSLQRVAKRATKEVTMAMDRLEKEEKKVIALAEQNQKLQKQKDDVEHQLRETAYTLEAANSDLSVGKLTIDSLKSLLERKTKEYDSVKQKLEDVEIAHDHLKTELEDERSEREAVEDQVAKLNIQVDKLKKATMQLKKQKDEAEALHVELKREIQDLRFAVEAEKQETLKIEREKRQALEKFHEESKKTDAINEDLTKIDRDRRRKERDADKFRVRVEEQAKSLKDLEKENENLKEQVKKLSDQNVNLDWKVDQALKEKDEAVRQLKELEITTKFSKQ